MQDLGDVAAFGSTRSCFETLDFPIAKGLNEDHEPGVDKTNSGGRRVTSKEESPDVDKMTDLLDDQCLQKDQR